MEAKVLYRLVGPTEWPRAPEKYSHSALRVMGECPLRWQLRRATYGDMRGFPERPRPSALVGKLVHHVLDRLFKALAEQGLPEVGSAAFREAMVVLRPVGLIQEELNRYQADLAQNPRAGGLRISEGVREIYNRACRLFHPVYAQIRAGRSHTIDLDRVTVGHGGGGGTLLGQLRRRGTLTEVRIEHPVLPLIGIVDLLWDDRGQTCIVDFKTGKEQPDHQEQLELYALLWWRVTGEAPGRLEVWYPEGRQTFEVDETQMLALEERLRERIDEMKATMARPPATARLGAACRFCDVRQFCDLYWAQPELPPQDGWHDVELTVMTAMSENSIQCERRGSVEIQVTIDREASVRHEPFQAGEHLRVLGVRADVESGELHFGSSTEVFRRRSI